MLGNESIHFNINYSELEGLIGTVNESRDGLMLSSGFIQRKQLNSSSDYNDCLLAGIYDISQARGSLNSPPLDAGVLIVFCNNVINRIIQMAIEVPGNILYIRCRTVSTIWGEWKQL